MSAALKGALYFGGGLGGWKRFGYGIVIAGRYSVAPARPLSWISYYISALTLFAICFSIFTQTGWIPLDAISIDISS